MPRVLHASIAIPAFVLGAVTLASAASAQGPANPGGRFTMHPVEGGVLRLDTQSGTMSMCRDRAGQWACEALPDERQTLEKEIDRLAVENKGLKDSIRKLEEVAGLPDSEGKPAAKSPSVQLPTEEDVDRAMSYIQRMLKKFKDKLKEFEDTEGRQTQRL